MINLEKVFEDVTQLDTVEAIQRLISQGVTPEQYKAAYAGSKTSMDGADLITQERQRQINQEGWTPEHDQQHSDGELTKAAVCYATPDDRRIKFDDGTPHFWPWHPMWWKPTSDDRIRELTKAGALIAAEIDRLLQLEGERS